MCKMAHAVVLHVKLAGDTAEGTKMLDEVVVPMAKAQPGFHRGTWMHNEAGTDGTGVIVFDTSEHATAAMAVMQPPPGGPTVISAAVLAVAREA